MEKLRSWLRERELTQAILAKRVEVTEGAISQWINGHSRPSLDNLVALSRETGISVDVLIEDLPERVN